MESLTLEYEREIENLKKENAELKERIIFLDDLVFNARDLAKGEFICVLEWDSDYGCNGIEDLFYKKLGD